MSRKVEKRIEIAVERAAVWKALTDARELTRWFPLEARVEPGVGGTVWYSWGARWEGGSRIEIWEPDEHLRTIASAPEGAETTETGQKPWLAEEAGVRLALDFRLEGSGGRTVLRLVHSGFGDGARWDDEYEGVNRGWEFELQSLKHYLERHLGKDRSVAWVRWRLGMPAERAWHLLVGPEGLAHGGFPISLSPGNPYSLVMTSGDALEGNVLVWDPPRQFAATVENMGGGLMRLELDQYGGSPEASLWLALHGTPAVDLAKLQDRWAAIMGRLFPAGPAPR